MDKAYGAVNEHLVGIAMKELVRRAIGAVRAERFAFEVSGKAGYDGAAGDMVTSADHRAQTVYLRGLRECFPQYGIIAEEDSLRVPARLPSRKLHFTVDPVDGTRALVRRQSHGIGTMLALVEEQADGGEVIAAWVGDVMTQEMYGFRPGSDKVHRISEFESAESLVFDTSTPLSRRYILLHDPVERHGPWIRSALDRGAFSGYEVMGGSIGIWLARLWKGEMGAALLPPSHETPWDHAPVVGISARMGFRFLEVAADGSFEEVAPRIALSGVQYRESDLLIVHQDHIGQLLP
jgi:fructose-1,6-bisphosphatase/inositol monophosphatase family enzyme